MRRTFGLDRAVARGEVDLRAGAPDGLLGAAEGRTVGLSRAAQGHGLEARLIAAHELAHVTGDRGGVDEEARADRVAIDAVFAGRGPAVDTSGARRRGALGLRGCPTEEREVAKAPTAAERARKVLDAFVAMSTAERTAWVQANYTPGSYTGVIRTHLDALPAAERTGRYRDTIRQVLQLVERAEVRASTAQTDAEMAAAQAAHMDALSLAEAQAATGSGAPSAADRQAAQQERTERLRLPPRRRNRWTDLPDDAARATFRTRAATAVARIVRRAGEVCPDLGITASHLHFDPDAIDGASDTRYAEYDRANNRLNFGMDFTDAAMSDPDYVLGTVVHEVFGHGEHGASGDSYALELFTSAHGQATGSYSAAERAAGPTGAVRSGFGYQGTEIYSELRESQYDVRAPSGSGIVQGDSPASDVRSRVGLIKENWEPSIARGLIRGLWARFSLDPRLTPAALQIFRDAVDHHYPGEDLLAARP